MKKTLTPAPAPANETNTCPRCGHGIPSDDYRGQYPGAVSRTDNRTYICSACGTDEALESVALGRPLPQSLWALRAEGLA